jgi:uncharacterized protein (PEP-CTERM system associated)
MVPEHTPPAAVCRVALAALALCGSAAAQAQAAAAPAGAPPQDWRIEPSITVRETFSDNARRTAVKDSDAITDLVAAIRVSRDRGALTGSLGYALTGSLSSRDSSRNEARHALNLAALAEVVPSTFFVDASAELRQQAVSAFGGPAPGSGALDPNEARTGALRLSPYLRGGSPTLGYEARLSHTVTRSEAAANQGDATFSGASLRVGNMAARAPLGWTVDLLHDTSDYAASRKTKTSRARLGLNYLVSGELRLGATVGRERSDVFVLGGESTNNYGLSAQWSPSPRTALDASAERRVFGTGHALRFTHRTANAVWTLASSRDVATPSVSGTGAFGSAYDLLSRRLESTEPDAAKRDKLVRDALAANGIDPNAVVTGGFLASAAVLQRAHSASLALVGARNTITLQVQASQSRRADTLSTALDDLTSVDELKQQGVLLDWALRLTPLSTVTVGTGYQRSEGVGGANAGAETTTKSFNATWSYQLPGGRSNVAAGLRHSNFSSATAPYEENAAFVSFGMRF